MTLREQIEEAYADQGGADLDYDMRRDKRLARRAQLADELRGAGWEPVAADVVAGIPLGEILARLHEDGQPHGAAAQIIRCYVSE
jgi:hypothetical protein